MKMRVLLLLVSVSMIGCKEEPKNGACPALTGAVAAGHLKDGTISSSETWTAEGSPYIIEQRVIIDSGATITIEPCAVVKGRAGRDIKVFGGGKLVAHGTADRPIVFDSLDPVTDDTTNQWGHLVSESSDDLVGLIDLAYVKLLHGGQLDCSIHCFPTGGVLKGIGNDVQNDGFPLVAGIHVDHVTIEDTPSQGIGLERNAAFTADSTDLTVVRAADGVGEVRFNSAGTIPSGSYTGNGGKDFITLKSGNTPIETSLTFHDRGVPYVIDDGSSTIYVGADVPAEVATLTFEPGVTLKVGDGFGFVVSKNGALVAKGTAEKPVVLTSAAATPAAGGWTGLTFNEIGASALDHVTIEYAGGNTSIDQTTKHCEPGGGESSEAPSNKAAAISVNVQPKTAFVTNSTIRASAGYGINLTYQGTPVDFRPTNTFTDVAQCKQTTPRMSDGTCPATVVCEP